MTNSRALPAGRREPLFVLSQFPNKRLCGLLAHALRNGGPYVALIERKGFVPNAAVG